MIVTHVILTTAIVVATTVTTMGQGEKVDVAFSGPVVFAEFLGASGGLTFNLEHKIFDFRRHMVSVRAGFGQHKSLGNSQRQYKGVPVSVGVVRGKGNHHREVGAGITYVEGNQEEVAFNWINKSVYFVSFVGYRYQRPAGGFFFKCQITPLVKIKEYSESVVYRAQVGRLGLSAGIGVGYYFAHDWRSR